MVLNTKVDLVIEALRLVAVDEAVRAKAEATLQWLQLTTAEDKKDRLQIKDATRYKNCSLIYNN